MFRHNLLITYRNFLRNKGSFLINLAGLSSGLTCVLLIALWVHDELNVDKFHKYDTRLYQVMEHVDQGGTTITRRTTAGPTAEALANEMPEVEYAITSTLEFRWPHTLSIEDKNLMADGIFADKDFFNMFSFDLIEGNRNQVLNDKKSMVISQSLANRLFGTSEGVIGKTIEWQHEHSYKVSGIMADIPNASSKKFDFVLTFEEFRDNNNWVTNWYNTMPQTFVLLKAGTDVNTFNDKIRDLIRTKTEGRAAHRTPFITPYSERYLYNHYENGAQNGGRIEYVQLFSIIAVFILLIACINFMNLSTARASLRMKEIGIKKTVGARRNSLVFQYLSESTIMALLSLGLALIMVILFLPQFNIITEKQLNLDLNLEYFGALLGCVILTGMIAGSYPAIYLSGIKPTIILKGKLSSIKSELWARKGLVVFQFALSVMLIVSVLVIQEQIKFTQNKNLGYEKDNILLLSKSGQLNDEGKLTAFLSEVINKPGILDVSSIGHNLAGHNGGTYGIQWPGKDPEDRTEFERFPVNYGAIELLGIDMKEGRTFSREFGADTAKVIFNEAAIEYMGLEDPLGQTVGFGETDVEIIGVFKDFHFESLHEKVKPLVCYLNPYRTNQIMVKIKADYTKEAIEHIEAAHKNFNAGFPFNFRFIDQNYQELYLAERKISSLSRYFAGLAILISCLGLFGLAAFTAERRTKEIGIRKILGASAWGIVRLLSTDFTKMVLIAIIIAVPVSYLISQNWLEGFAYKISLEWWYFVGAALVTLIIAWLTVSVQTLKAANINPAECLRDE